MGHSLREQQPWREEDTRLLERLRDEQALDELWRFVAPSAASPLPRRASVLVEHARKLDGGAAAAHAAAGGAAHALAELLASARLATFSPPLLHAVAVFFARVGRAQLALGSGSEGERAAQSAFLRSLAAWLALEEKPRYLCELGSLCADGALSADEVEHAVSGVTRALEMEIAREAERGAKDLLPAAAVQLRVLGRMSEACRSAGLAAKRAAQVLERADRLRARAVDAALSSVVGALDDARARGAALDEGPAHFARLHAIWLFADRDVGVERVAAERLVALAWDAHVEREWTKMRHLLAPCLPLFDNLEARIVSNPLEHIAYAAHAAQVLVFRCEADDTNSEIPLLERAVRVCPSHRNARSVLAHHLCERVIRVVGRASVFSARSDLAEAARLLGRAQAVFAPSPRIADASAALDAARKRFGVSA